MRTDLKAKFLQHLNRKQDDKGFTLVELLVVIIIIGILAAIALPNFLNQGAKAKQTEAKQNVGLINRTQTAFRTENPTFATSFDQLAVGTLSGAANSATTTNYSYDLQGAADFGTIVATATDTALKGYAGGTSRSENPNSESIIASVLCEALAVGIATPGLPVAGSGGGAPTCDPSTKTLN
jgi:type IV pilus assembly protein PilA